MPPARRKAALAQRQRGVLLSDFLGERAAGAEALDGGDRLRVIDTLLAVIGGVYCHLPQKRAAYAVDPVQALTLVRKRVGDLTDGEFHLAITSIVTSLRDAHTRYSGPRMLNGRVAALPFLVEQYGPQQSPTFLVSKVSDPALIPDRQFREGVTLTDWNGVPFVRAVDLHAERETGGRPDSRRARALESLTLRALEYGPPPDERWVWIGYKPPRGRERQVKIPWRVIEPGVSVASTTGSRASRFVAADPAAEQARRAKKLLFSGRVWEADRRGAAVARSSEWVKTTMPDVLAARGLPHRRLGALGYLRIWSFDVADDDAFIAEVVRLLGELPDRGLVLDLRGNPGGLIWAAERLLQVFTPNVIVPTRFSLVATPLVRAMARSPFNRLELEAWLPSLEQAIETGEPYSQPLPLTDVAWCNDLGQVYGGPAVCVVDPNTYSSGDLFAAGFVDNAVGPIVSVGEASGGGGANVWGHDEVREALAGTESALPALPHGVGYTLAFRRAVRSAGSDGIPVEDLGIAGTPYAMTRADLLDSNSDLVAFCGDLLAQQEYTAMRVTVTDASILVRTQALEELEVFADGRAHATVPIEGAATELPRPSAAMVELVGRAGGVVRQRRRITLR